ncbi:MAG: type I methionyl aminopeptidase [Chloroflexi bacterium]|nr:MAG: type I methionyl aminopeptidase [Chloroflexota bacterium]
MTKLRRQLLRRNVRHQTNGTQSRAEPVFKDPREIQIMREAGRIVARVHVAMKEAIKPGVSTLELDQIALEILRKHNATSSFYGYNGFPANICASINDELVHGIPSAKRILKEGDIISIDIGSYYRGFVGDSGWTYSVGKVSEDALRVMAVTEASLWAGIAQAVPGNQVRDISRAIQQYVESQHMYIVKEYTGHGIGKAMHEAPQVLNYVSGDGDSSLVLRPGLVLAIEPMVQLGTEKTRTLRDKWTVVSKDHCLSAHFEHTVAITNQGPEILTLL